MKYQDFPCYEIEDITWPRGETVSLTSERSEILSATDKLILLQQMIKFVSPSGHAMLCLLYRYWWNAQIKQFFIFIFKKLKKWSPKLSPSSQNMPWQLMKRIDMKTKIVSFCSKKVKSSFKNVNKDENKRKALLLLADHVSNRNNINILTCWKINK